VAVYGHSFIQAIKTTKNCYDTVKFHAWIIDIFLPRAIWWCGLSGMFFSNIKNLCQCGLYGAAGNLQETMVL
jgi:hypothetical protein